MADYVRNLVLALIGAAVFGLCLGALKPPKAAARDLGQWEETTPETRAWYKSLMQPDNPNVSCCGESDLYWADEVHVRDGKTFATITDDRDDGPLGRPHVPVGTEIEIPDHKQKHDRGNPSGHALLFLSSTRQVYCYIQNGGY